MLGIGNEDQSQSINARSDGGTEQVEEHKNQHKTPIWAWPLLAIAVRLPDRAARTLSCSVMIASK